MFHSILWPIDGSAHSIKPMQAVIDLARQSRAQVVLLSIAEPRLFRASGSEAFHSGKTVESLHLDAARQATGAVRGTLRQAGLVCHDIVSLSPLPGADIIHTAQKVECDLIVMATHARMGVLDTMLNRSITQEVIKGAGVPVLVFP